MNKASQRLVAVGCRVAIVLAIAWCYCHATRAAGQQAPNQLSSIPGSQFRAGPPGQRGQMTPSQLSSIPAASAPKNRLILPGDDLEVLVVEDASFNGTYKVRRGGEIILPTVGRINVAGETLQEATVEVREALATQLQHVTVTVKETQGLDGEDGPYRFPPNKFTMPHPFEVVVTGRVKQPCMLPLKPGDKLGGYEAILKAGGFAPFADLTIVYLIRFAPSGAKVEMQFNVRKIMNGESGDIPLQGNDAVVVPEKFYGEPD